MSNEQAKNFTNYMALYCYNTTILCGRHIYACIQRNVYSFILLFQAWLLEWFFIFSKSPTRSIHCNARSLYLSCDRLCPFLYDTFCMGRFNTPHVFKVTSLYLYYLPFFNSGLCLVVQKTKYTIRHHFIYSRRIYWPYPNISFRISWFLNHCFLATPSFPPTTEAYHV